VTASGDWVHAHAIQNVDLTAHILHRGCRSVIFRSLPAVRLNPSKTHHRQPTLSTALHRWTEPDLAWPSQRARCWSLVAEPPTPIELLVTPGSFQLEACTEVSGRTFVAPMPHDWARDRVKADTPPPSASSDYTVLSQPLRNDSFGLQHPWLARFAHILLCPQRQQRRHGSDSLFLV